MTAPVTVEIAAPSTVAVEVAGDPAPIVVEVGVPSTVTVEVDGRAGPQGVPGPPGAATAVPPLAIEDGEISAPGLADVATSGEYADLTGTPTLGTAAGADITDFDASGAATAAQAAAVAHADSGDATEAAARIAADTALASSVTAETNRATAAEALKANSADLAAVATSGDYGDLDNLPTLGTAAAQNTTAFDAAGAAASAQSAAISAAASDATTKANAAQAASQPLDADLTTIAALDSSTAGALVTDGAGWIRKTYAQLKTALTLTKADVGLGNVDNTADSAKTFTESQVTDLVSDLAAKAPTSRQIGNGNGITGGGDLTDDRTLAVALSTATGVLAANTSTGVSANFTDIMSTATLAAGTWLIVWTVTVTPGASPFSVSLKVAAGTATASIAGPTGTSLSASATLPYMSGAVAHVVTVTSQGTLKLQAASHGATAQTVLAQSQDGAQAATGYAAVRIA